MSLDYPAVYAAGKYSILGAAVSWVFGYFIGKVLEQAETGAEPPNQPLIQEKKKKQVQRNVTINPEQLTVDNKNNN